jgi:hypothetical protein
MGSSWQVEQTYGLTRYQRSFEEIQTLALNHSQAMPFALEPPKPASAPSSL